MIGINGQMKRDSAQKRGTLGWLFFVVLIMASVISRAQNMQPFVVYSGSYYMAHEKVGGQWTVTGKTQFGPECVWLSNSNIYCFIDTSGGTLDTLYLRSDFAAGADMEITSTAPTGNDYSYNGTGTDSVAVSKYYFYNWDWGMAHGREITSGTCPEWYNNGGNSECWQCYWVVYDTRWHMTTASSYDIPMHAANFRRIKIFDHEITIVGSSFGIRPLPGYNIPNGSSQPLNALSGYVGFVDTTRSAYTTYQISDIECTGDWTDRTCDSTWTIHNYYDGADHLFEVPPAVPHAAHDAPVSYLWTFEGPATAYVSFSSSVDTFMSTISNPRLYFRRSLTTGNVTGTLTLTVSYDDGATQTTSCVVTLITGCGNPRSEVTHIDYDGVTISWAMVQTTDFLIRYKKADPSVTSWEDTITGIHNVWQYTFTGLDYETEYLYQVVGICGSNIDWNSADTMRFTTARTPRLQIGGAVFGGGRMADVQGNTTVVVSNCDTIGALYGGNDIAGQVQGNAGSTIVLGVDSSDYDDNRYGVTNDVMRIGSVYGGGNGYYTYDGHTPGTEVGTTEFTNMQFSTSVGNADGSESATLSGFIPTIAKTSISVNNDYVKIDSLFGGAKNAFVTTSGSADTSTRITIDGGTIYAVFGGNNFGGTLGDSSTQQITLNMTSTLRRNNIQNTATTGLGRDFGIRYLFGGGNKVNSPHSDVVMHGGQVDSLFAGGNSATVGKASLLVNCYFANITSDWKQWDKTITSSIYDMKPSKDWRCTVGGVEYTGTDYNNLYKTWSSHTPEQRAIYDSLNAHKSTFDSLVMDRNYTWDNKGTYNIRALFGGNNRDTMDIVPDITLSAGGIGTVYGGGNAGPMTGWKAGIIDTTHVKYSTHVLLDSPNLFIDRVYGGCQMSDVAYSTWADIRGGHIGTVFGGCNISGDIGSTRVNPNAAAGTPEYYAVQGGSWVWIQDGHIHKNVYGGSDGFYHCNDNIYYTSGINYGEQNYVGLKVPTHNETHAIIEGGTIMGSVYAGGNLANVGFPTDGVDISSWRDRKFPMTVGISSVHIHGGKIVKNVYGGGNMASIYGINDVHVEGGEIHGALYGGNDRAGRVRKFALRSPQVSVASDGVTPKGNVTTYVHILGSPKVNTVFGGGNGDYDYSENSDVPICGDPELNKPIQEGTFVDINIDDGGADSGSYIGTVYGGGDGVYVSGDITVFMNVEANGTALSGKDNVGRIFGGNNMGDLTSVPDIILLNGQVHDVYGGSNQGNMNGIVEHNIGGIVEVGSYVRLMKEYRVADTVLDVNATISGNVFGGCCLSDVVNNSLVLVEGGNHSGARIFGGNDISGTVFGSSNVIIDSSAIVSQVFGGGNGNYNYNSNGTVTVPVASGDSIVVTKANLSRPYSEVAYVQLKGGEVRDNVYGGGLAGDCGATQLTVRGNSILKGMLFGGGRGIIDSIGIGSANIALASHHRVGNVHGTATTLLHSMDASATSTLSSVYAGGQNSNVGSTSITLLPTFQHTLAYLYGGSVSGNVDSIASITIRGTDDGENNTVDTVYGGNDYAGRVQTTVVTIDSGRFNSVFGGGNGHYRYLRDLTQRGFTPGEVNFDTVPYSMDVTINFNGGYYVGNVYGGGNLGLVGNRDMNPYSMLATSDSLARDTNIGHITLNIHSPSYFERHVFAGAKGVSDMTRNFFSGSTFSGTGHLGRNVDNTNPLGKQLAYAQKIVNMDGGTIHFSLYGGSEAVDDGFPFECIGNSEVYYYKESRLNSPARGNHNSTLRPSSIINIVGGNVRKNIYGAGYQGNTYGSVYVNVGRKAVEESPVWSKNYGGLSMAQYKPVIGQDLKMGEDLVLEASIYNGSDWGEANDHAYFNTRGVYGGETNILLDGKGYNTFLDAGDADLLMPSMNLSYSLMGSGTSTEGGDVNRLITMKHYGNYYDCEKNSREMFSIQRADKVVLDSVFVVLKGEQDAFMAYTSSNYSLSRIDTMLFLNDNIVTMESASSYLGNLVSMKPGVDSTLTQISNNDYLYTNDTVDGIYTSDEGLVANDMLDNLHSQNDCGSGSLNESCDDLDICDKLPVMRGDAGYSSNVNTLVLRNGSYVKVAPFVDDYNNNNRIDRRADGKDDSVHFGHVKGWMYMVSEDATQSYVYGADKGNVSGSLLNMGDGGFVGLCSCENSDYFSNYSNEMNYERIVGEYRSWKNGTKQGRRTRNISLVANADPDSVLNWRLPSNASLPVNYDNGNLVGPGDPANYYQISPANGNDSLAYATAILELPPSEDGHFYLINEIIVDQDNGYQMQLTDQVYDAATNSIFELQTGGVTTLSNVFSSDQDERNKTFALAFSTDFPGSNFESNTCWNNPSNPNAPQRTFEPNGGRDLREGDDYKYCWPISSISGNPYFASVNGYISRAVVGGEGVVPSIMFTLTYDTRLSNTLTRDVLFVIDEYDDTGGYVGPINVTVTISTVIKGFTNMEATVMAMYNEGIENEYVRKVTIPSSFMQRDLWLQGIEWENNAYSVNANTPVSPSDCYVVGDRSDWFYLQSLDSTIDNTHVSDASRFDNGKTYCGNNLFSLTLTPSESSSESVNNHLAWVDINEEARGLDIYQTALDDYIATKLADGGDPAKYNDSWDFTRGDLAEYNKKRSYSSFNYNDSTGARRDTSLMMRASGYGLHIGTLDGRSTASMDVKLHYNGDYVYHDYYTPALGVVKLHFYWENTKYRNVENDEGERIDRGTMTLTINLRTRESGDTIYLAPGTTLTRTPEGSNTPLTMHSWQSQHGSQSFSHARREEVVNNPDAFLNTLKEAMIAYEEGDVISIMETLPVNNSSEATTVHGDDYNVIQIIRYSGNHWKFPTLGCANKNALLDVKEDGRLYLRNVWLNGSGCTRLKTSPYPNVAKYSAREPGLLLSHAPVIYCHNHGEVNMSSNVTVSNNLNFGHDSLWNATSQSWYANTDPNYHRGGAIAIVRDLTYGTKPKVIMGDKCRVFDNAVVDMSSSIAKLMATTPTPAGTPTVALVQPQNYGGGIYVEGGLLQLGTSSAVSNNVINIARNYYITDTSNDAGTRTCLKHELGGSNTEFPVFYLDTVRHPECFSLSNVHLTRATSNQPDFWPEPGSVRRDTISDHIAFVSDFAKGSRVGVNKWFPGYRYDNQGHYLYNTGMRDTICVAVDYSNKPRVAEINYQNNVFFNDSVFHYDTDESHYLPYRPDGVTYDGNLADSLAPRFVAIDKHYTAYHNDQTKFPDYSDQVWTFYSPYVSKTHYYLQRCASFGAGVSQQSIETMVADANGRQVRLRQNDYVLGDSIYYRWDQNATCVASTDSIVTMFGGGFFPYTYQWYNDSILDDNIGHVDFKRIPVRRRTTMGNNSIATINSAAGVINRRNEMLRYRAQHDTMVLRSLVQKENSRRSTYFYSVEAFDATGHCRADLPVMIRVAKLAPDDSTRHGHGTNYYIDSSNFLRHRNQFPSYEWAYDPEYDELSFYFEQPVCADTLIDNDHPEWGAEKRYDGIVSFWYDGTPYFEAHPELTPTERDELIAAGELIPNADFFRQKTVKDQNGDDSLWYWVNYQITQNIDQDIMITPYPWADDYRYEPLGDYLYYRIGVPGVDSSSFHDKVDRGTLDDGNGGTFTVFFNAKGDTLYPYIRGWNQDIETYDEFLAGKNRSDTLDYEVVKHVGGVEKHYRDNVYHTEIFKLEGGDWVSADGDSDAPEMKDFFPLRHVPHRVHGVTSDRVGSQGGIRRAGYSHVPMHWFNHGYNRGTLEDRIKAESFEGKPYHDEKHILSVAEFYTDENKTDRIDTISPKYYSSRMIPRYMRVYRSYHIKPSIYPADAAGYVTGFSANTVNLDYAATQGDTLNLKNDEFCPGDIVKLRPIASTSSERWPGQNPQWRYVAWDFDASSDSIATFVVGAIHSDADSMVNQPVAYFAPGPYWWQHVTHLPPTSSYVRHNNGDVTIKDSTGLAWLISVVNGYNGQNARTFEHNKIYFDFDSVNMSRYRWTPIGDRNNPFEGEIVVADGKRGKISGIYVSEETVPLVGMFGYTTGAKLNGFALDSILISGNSYVGGLVAFADSNTSVSYVSMDNAILFGEQYTGGIAAQSFRANIDRDTVYSVAMMGNAIYAGGVVGQMDQSTLRNTSVDVNTFRLSSIYFGGIAGKRDDVYSTRKMKHRAARQSLIENNYVHLTTYGGVRRVGGIIGSAQNVILNNNYAYGTASGSDYTGGVAGYIGGGVSASNNYYVRGMADRAYGIASNPDAVQNSTTFSGSGNNVMLAERVNGYTNMTRALNRWVITHGGDSLYATWRSAYPGENGGYPVFGIPDIIRVVDSASQTVCDEMELDGISYYESGRYVFHIVDSADYVDSTFILNLTVNHGDTTNYVDSVKLGSGYQGYGVNLTPEQVSALFGDDHSLEVVALQYVDSLLSASGCDSLVVLTLYVLNDNTQEPDVPQQLIDVNVYPNPTTGIVNVEGSDLMSIEVYDNISRKVLQREVDGNKTTFDLTNYPTGGYYVRVKTAHGTVVKKLIKK